MRTQCQQQAARFAYVAELATVETLNGFAICREQFVVLVLVALSEAISDQSIRHLSCGYFEVCVAITTHFLVLTAGPLPDMDARPVDSVQSPPERKKPHVPSMSMLWNQTPIPKTPKLRYRRSSVSVGLQTFRRL